MIFVTGANGLLGSYTCKALVKAGYQVKGLVRSKSNTGLLDELKDKIALVTGDILDPESITNELVNCKIIIHCAAVVSFHQSDKNLMNEVNITGTGNMVNLALKNNIEYFIQISSVAALGRLLGVGQVDETNKWEASKWNSNYAQSKYFGELEVWRGAEEGLKTVILNPSIILAPGDWHRSSGRLFKYVWDENPFYPSGQMNFVDVRDVAHSVLKCIELRPNKERYIVNSGMVSYKSMFEEIAQNFNKKPPKFKSSAILIKIGMALQYIKSIFTGKKSIITKETSLLSKSEIYFNNAKILNELNLTFASLSDSVKWNCEEFLKNIESEKIK